MPAGFPLREAAQAGRTQRNMEMMVRRGGDDARRILLNTAPIYAEGGELLAGVIVFTDVTRQREMELQLRQSEKMQAIGKLAGGIAHDFNNQLAGIMGYAELLKLNPVSDESKKYAEMICLAAQRAADLTNELLAFARKGRYRMQPVDLNLLIDEVTALLSRTIDKRISIESDRCEEAAVMGDPTQLQNALLNIAINARDAMPKGGVLAFRTRVAQIEPHDEDQADAALEPGEYVRLDISDTGVGMDEEVRQRIFEPFFTTKSSGEGTGMGLAAVYGTIQSHKGHVSVRTAPGEGTVFSILLPRCMAPGPTREASPKPAARGGANTHILIVDDEAVVRNVSAEMLCNLGYRVTACEGGAEALEFYSEKWREVDIVLLDMIMPDMNGSEVFKALKAVNPRVKVLLCSGFSLSADAQEMLQNGALGFLGKPYTITTLSERLTEALA